MTMRGVQFQPGGPELMTIGDVPRPVLREHDIMVKVYATAVNRADTLQRRGLYPPPAGESDILGLEAAGTVSQLGSDVTSWQLGDRVMVLLAGGGNAEYVRVHETHVIPIPDSMTYTDAAAIPEVWLTAYQLLFFVGKCVAGETVLIHAGASGVGTAAVQLAKHAGIRVLVTAGSPEKLDLAKSLGAEHGFNYKQGDFDEQLMQYTQERGVDVVLDCIGASYWEKNTRVLTVDGRWVLYGSMGGVHVDGKILGVILRKRLSLLGTILRTRSTQYKGELVAKFTHHALPLFQDGTYKPIVDSIMSLDQLPDAHRRMESNANKGKIVIQVVPPEKPHNEL